jgi:uncharacterized membrane protein YvbJ
MTTCKKCGKPTPAEANFCNQCGESIPKKEGLIKCKNCGAETPNSNFCGQCGTNLK